MWFNEAQANIYPAFISFIPSFTRMYSLLWYSASARAALKAVVKKKKEVRVKGLQAKSWSWKKILYIYDMNCRVTQVQKASPSPISTREDWAFPVPSWICTVNVPSLSSVKWSSTISIMPVATSCPILVCWSKKPEESKTRRETNCPH